MKSRDKTDIDEAVIEAIRESISIVGPVNVLLAVSLVFDEHALEAAKDNNEMSAAVWTVLASVIMGMAEGLASRMTFSEVNEGIFVKKEGQQPH